MTIPYLMNCDHMDNGWCLECTKKLGDENRSLQEELGKLNNLLNEENLNNKQIHFVMNCVMEWIELYQTHLKRCPTPADALHSALLNRLLSGKKAMPQPPPKRFSYPDYKLAEGEVCDVMEINTVTVSPEEKAEFLKRTKGYTVCVDQHTGWKWVKKNGNVDERGIPETGTLEYKDGTQYRFWWGMKQCKRLDHSALEGVITFEERTKFIQLIKKEGSDARTN